MLRGTALNSPLISPYSCVFQINGNMFRYRRQYSPYTGDGKTMPRRYELKKRAQTAAETRQKIVRAVVDLHGSVGPAQTTVSAIAERAGVRRATVYEHFPDERAIFEACTQHFFADFPPPDYRHWASLPDPTGRLSSALQEVYAYHRRTEHMMGPVFRDAPLKPLMLETSAVQAHIQYWQEAFQVLLEPWLTAGSPNATMIAALRHALDFQTWHSLVQRQGLGDKEAAELMVRLVRCS